MNIQEVKNIRIADYLQSLGYTPVKQQGNGLWYKSPFREETEASFKVNTDRNLWFDYGLGKGGNIIALAEELYATDHVPYLLNKIAERVPHIRPVSFSFRQHSSEPSFQHLEVGELTHPALLRYLQERGINTDLARLEWRITVETSLNVPQQNVEELISIIDNYIIDIKDMNNNIYQRYTGKNNENVLGNLRYLIGKDKAKQIVIRTPLIPSYNTEKDIDQSIELLKEMGITQFDRFTYKTPND